MSRYDSRPQSAVSATSITPVSRLKDEPVEEVADIMEFQQQERRQSRAWFLIFVTAIQCVALFSEFIINYQLTGSLIETSPFNIMIGPGAYTLIKTGARFAPCMKGHSTLTGKSLQCPAKMSSNNDGVCTVADLCGIDANTSPNQWWRFFAPIFLHGGLLHLAFNLSFQIQSGFPMEKDFGWWRMAIIYLSSGTFGFIFGANFASETSRMLKILKLY